MLDSSTVHIQAALDNNVYLCPSLALLVNNIEFHEPTDPSAPWWPDIQRRELATASHNLTRAREAGGPPPRGWMSTALTASVTTCW